MEEGEKSAYEQEEEDSQRFIRKANRISKGILFGALGLLCYQLGGYGYQIYESTKAYSSMKGFSNTPMDEEFYEEQWQETISLEERLKAKNKDEGTVITVNVYVSPELKQFFDNARIPEDDSRWTDEVEKALSGLDVYNKYGYSIEYDSVFTGPEDTAMYEPGELNFLFAPAKQPPSAYNEMLFGYTKIGGDTAVILLTTDSELNRHTLAHEAGHMLGMDHRKISIWERLIDPFGLLERGLMADGTDSMDDYSFSEEEEAIINKAKERFEGPCIIPISW